MDLFEEVGLLISTFLFEEVDWKSHLVESFENCIAIHCAIVRHILLPAFRVESGLPFSR